MINLSASNTEATLNSPRVSIGMPVYNGEQFICEALDSLLTQTFTNFELIISDNASTDQTETICRKYCTNDDRVRYIRQSQNLGAPANFKFVLDTAVAEYFMWAAADDVWDKNWIEVLYPIALANQCLAFGMVKTIDSAGKPKQHPVNNRPFDFSGSSFIRRLKFFFYPDFLGKANQIYGIFPKRFMKSNIFDILTSRLYGTDMLLLYRLLKDIEFLGGSSVFLFKRIHSGCAGGDAEVRNIKKKNMILRSLKLPADIVNHQHRSLINYGSMSSVGERIVQLLLTPLIFFIHLFYLIIINPRFSRNKAVP